MSSPGRPGLAKFNGMLDNVRAYGRALSEQEVARPAWTLDTLHGLMILIQFKRATRGGAVR